MQRGEAKEDVRAGVTVEVTAVDVAAVTFGRRYDRRYSSRRCSR